MMSATLRAPTFSNPLDLLEEIVSANEWPFERMNDDELAAGFTGHWCQYQMHFAWCPDLNAVSLICSLDLRIPPRRQPAISHLLSIVNTKLWLGHFEIYPDEGIPTFRYTALMRGTGPSVEQLEDLIGLSVTECERFYPAFQFVTWSGKDASEAVAAAMLETVGEA